MERNSKKDLHNKTDGMSDILLALFLFDDSKSGKSRKSTKSKDEKIPKPYSSSKESSDDVDILWALFLFDDSKSGKSRKSTKSKDEKIPKPYYSSEESSDDEDAWDHYEPARLRYIKDLRKYQRKTLRIVRREGHDRCRCRSKGRRYRSRSRSSGSGSSSEVD